VLFDLAKLVYEVKSSSQTNVGGEVSEGRIFRVEIDNPVSCTCMTPTLLHLPCSHIITACHMRRVLHEGSKYMSPYYSLSTELKTSKSRFEPLLNPSQWPEYDGMYYVSDVIMRNIRKERYKNKRFCNKMDDIEKGYKNDMYDLGDFDQIKNKVRCSVCHTEGHNINRHKKESKRNPRPCGATGRNPRSGATDIVEVTHTSNIEKLFNLLVCNNIICCTCNFFYITLFFNEFGLTYCYY
jgi:hypothetical protein